MDDRTGTTAYKSDSNTIEIEPSASSLSFEQEQFMKDVQQGLTNSPKSLPCKYFYDQRGSELFEQICQLDEYYITRTELALLNKINTELAQMIGPQATIIEPGAGAGIKIQALLQTSFNQNFQIFKLCQFKETSHIL